MNRILSIVLCSVLFSILPANGKVIYTRQDSVKVVSLLKTASKMADNTNWMIYFARQLRGIPYVAHTLDKEKEENLVVNLRELDCTTYVESVVALTECRKKRKYRFQDYCDMLRTIRYENGEVAYAKRLHYFTAWIDSNTRKGIVAKEIQGPNPPFTKVQTIKINYMSAHPNLYAMLKAHPTWVKDIKSLENQYNGRKYRYIPKSIIANTQLFRQTIKDGDILAILTSKDGLDTSHIGIAVWHKDGLHLLNASMVRHKVVEEPWTLPYYMSRHPSQTGIRVIRIAK